MTLNELIEEAKNNGVDFDNDNIELWVNGCRREVSDIDVDGEGSAFLSFQSC